MVMTVKESDKLEIVSLYDFEDFRIGHAEDEEGITGCSVILCNNREKSTAGYDVRGGAPGTRNLDVMAPQSCYDTCQGIILSGGSLLGLNAAGGVDKFLIEQGIGEDFGDFVLPSVAQAIIFDLSIGSHKSWPDEEMAYEACQNAYKTKSYLDGNVGVGIGATVGKLRGKSTSMKGGIGTYCFKKGPLYLGCIIAVNAVGDVVDPQTLEIVAGAISPDGTFVNTEEDILNNFSINDFEISNTTIGVILTNAILSHNQAHKIAGISHDGLARAIRPVHTMADGDTMFTMATGEVEACMNLVGVMAVAATERAIISAVKNAESLDGVISYREMAKGEK